MLFRSDPALIAALQSDAFYIGALGSKKTHAKRHERMTAAGFDAATIGRIKGPVGLPIGARSPAEIAVAVLAEAVLSFIGVGPPPPTPTWGNIISEGRNYIREAPWISLYPGIAIAITVLGLNLLGDGLRDVLDPRMKVETR